jgi:hypothetical protein
MRPPPYSPIVDRPPLRWPDGARVAVWPMLAVEHFVWGQPGTAIQPLLTEHPEVANWGLARLRESRWGLATVRPLR